MGLRLAGEPLARRTVFTKPEAGKRAVATESKPNAEKKPFLSEEFVASAKVVDEVGGFALRIQFDHQGATMLEQITTENRGRKIAIFSQFAEKLVDYRWLAAPIISHRITDGVLVFTPDTTREEAEEIALGLNNVSKKAHTWVEQ